MFFKTFFNNIFLIIIFVSIRYLFWFIYLLSVKTEMTKMKDVRWKTIQSFWFILKKERQKGLSRQNGKWRLSEIKNQINNHLLNKINHEKRKNSENDSILFSLIIVVVFSPFPFSNYSFIFFFYLFYLFFNKCYIKHLYEKSQ